MDLRQLQLNATAIAKTLQDRRENDPLFKFVPHKKQQAFIDSILKGETTESWALYANRAGKSDGASFIGATIARFGMPDKYKSSEGKDNATSGWVVSLDFPTSRDIIQPKYFDNKAGRASHDPFIPDREIQDWRVADQILILKNGSIIGFKSADSGRAKFQGVEREWIHFDEEPNKEVYDECTIRIGTRPLLIFASCTLLPPEGQIGGVTWAFEQFAKPYMAGTLKSAKVFTASMYDNPYLSKDAIAQYESKYKPDSVEFRIRVLGELLPGLSGARCYTGFSYPIHVREQSSYYNPNAPLAWYIDFNVSPFISGVGQRDGTKFRCMKELLLEEGNHDQMCDLFFENYGNHSGEIWLYGDATGQRKNVQTGLTDYTIILNNMRKHGKNIKLKLPSVNPNVPDRINAVNVAFRSSEGIPNIEIDPSCVELIADLEQVLRDSRGGIKKSNNHKDPYYRRSHSCLTGDALISVPNGFKRISDISVGDYVKLPSGAARVSICSEKIVDEILVINLSNGAELRCTPEHKILTDNGLCTADGLEYGVTILTEDHPCVINALKLLAENTTLGLRTCVTMLAESGLVKRTLSDTFIGNYGKLQTAKSLKGFISTISTKLQPITELKTWLVSQVSSICQSMARIQIGQNLAVQPNYSGFIATEPQHGTVAKKAESGILSTAKNYGGKWNNTPMNVLSAIRSFCLTIKCQLNFVQEIACLRIEESQKSITKIGFAWLATILTRLISTKRIKPVVVSVHRLTGKFKVYDITVEKHHCYLANGLLVSNSDGFGYWVAYEAPVTQFRATNKRNEFMSNVMKAPSYGFSKR